MKILTLHCDYIRFQAVKKAFKNAPEGEDMNAHEVKECLVVLTAVENGDSSTELNQMLAAVKKTASEVKANKVVLYPYAHLSSNLANPELALSLLKEAEVALKKEFTVTRAPFGYYKTFELKCKGHPLSELSKSFGASATAKPAMASLPTPESDKPLTDADIKRLITEMGTTKLDTTKLKENDHRILGQKLDLFSFNEAAPGSAFWHPAGLSIYNKLIDFVRTIQNERDYQEIVTPQLLSNSVWKVSGHWFHYRDNMFLTSHEDRGFALKAMNCPAAMLFFRSKTRSYRDLPLRLAEFGLVHRKELSGVLAGLFRVIKFTQDDTHIFCMHNQIESEIGHLLELIEFYYKKTFNLDYHLELSTRPESSMGTEEQWNNAERALENALKKAKAPYKVNKGDGAFYGPKIDLHIKDSLGRSWQCGTIQLDMQMPQRFQLSYTNENNTEETPLVIHRALFGSIERFIGILLEHTNGDLPFWLAPRQVRVINFTDRNKKAAEKVVKELKKSVPNLKIDVDYRSDTIQSKIRDAEMLKVHYVIVIGDKEEETKTIAIRPHGAKPQFGVKIESFVNQLEKEMLHKSL